jgi:tetratricopeptide (TPR) repeat protein
MTTMDVATKAPAWEREAAAVRAHDPLNRIVALAVGIFILAIYMITLSPDVSFWDSGEFIATSHSLGIPHPPGTPLYVLLGRVSSVLFHGILGIATPARAVNMLSAIPSAIAAVFLYLCVVRVGKKIWNGGDQSARSYPAMIAGATAALFAAFANTLWINSIEAEVYAVSGMWLIFTTWLILLWADSHPKDERLLVVIAYLLALNIGVHLATYLTALAILPFAFLYEKRLAIPVSFLVVLTMAKDMQFFLLIVALLVGPTLQLALLPSEYKSRHRGTLLSVHTAAIVLALWAALGLQPSMFRSFLLFGAPLAAVLLPWFGLRPPRKVENPFTDLGFLLTLVTVLGVSCHLYLPIRSALDPAINEAQPDNWRAFWDVILRAQYRPVSVFERQAPWVFQFDNMFWRYFREQWPLRPGWPPLLMLLGIPGVILHLRRDPRSFVLFGLLFLWTSAVLVVKMNFTDSEVRERDYFFAPGFFIYTTWMGIGLAWLVQKIRAGFPSPWARPVAAGAAALAIAVATIPVRTQWESHDRRGNWIANDYAYNMLVALDKDAILFTNGDNDTFPLWYLQEVDGFRKDVRIINLSLLNTPWYGEQLRDEEPRVPMGLSVEELRKLRPVQDPSTGKIYLVKDQVAMDIVNTVFERKEPRPVYFAVTVDDLMGLEKYLQLEGLVFQLNPDVLNPKDDSVKETKGDAGSGGPEDVVNEVNLVKTRRNLEEVYRYRGLLLADGSLDPEVYRDPNEQKLITNYAAAWARMSLALRERGDMPGAIECMKNAVRVAPHYDPIVGSLGGILIEGGAYEDARQLYLQRVEETPGDVRSYIGLAYLATRDGKHDEALDWYLRGLRIDPNSVEILAGMYQSYVELGRYSDAENVLRQWVALHPTDESAKSVLEELRRRMRESSGNPPSPRNADST